MPEYTPNLNLYLPGGGGSGTIPDEIADIDKLNENFRLIDASLGGSIVPAVAGYTPKFNGELAYVQSTKSLFINDGGVTSVRGTPLVASEVTRDLTFPAPEQGDTVFRTDKGWVETYYAAYHATTNVGGATPAGWYPVAGKLPKGMLRWTSLSISSNLPAKVPVGSLFEEYLEGISRSGSSLIAPIDGFYAVSANFMLGTAGSALLSGSIRRGDTVEFTRANAVQVSGSDRNALQLEALIPASAGQEINVFLWASVGLLLDNVGHIFSASYVGPKATA